MRSGSVLSEFGVSMQDAISMIVGANESVQDAEKVGTAIKTMATNLGGVKAAAKDGSLEMNRTAKALQTIAGIDIYSNKQKGEIKDMMTILKELNVVWDDLSEDKQLAIAESISGKNHINTLMAMMGNWETVLQYQEDYNNGFTIGSAQREQERYLDSIEGKWNTLKENLKNLVTTTISSDFAKGFLDGAISFTDGLNSAFKVLDEFNAVLPATIGLITSLGQSFRVLSGNGSIELFGSGMINGIKSFNEALKGTTIKYSTTNNGIQKLANNQTKLSKSTTKTSDSFKQYSLRVGDASQSIVRINRENTTLAKSQTKVAGGMKNVISSFSQSAAGSKLAMVGTSLLNGALIGLASWGIGQAITAFDNYINRHEIAAEKARESIDVINGEIQGYQSQKKSLESISKEYDSLAKKTNKTASEIERFSELKNEIANIMPDLVLGYDENNDPILAMNGNVQDLIKELDRAVESKQRLLESKENDLGINATENIKKAAKELESSYTSMKLALQGGSITSNNALSDKNWWGGEVSIKERTQKVIKALEDEEKAYNERYNEHLANLEEYYAREQEIQKKNLNEIFKKDSYKALQDDLKGNVNSFAALFDWGEYDLSGQKQMVRGIEDLTKAVAEGKIDLEDFNTRWQSINDTFQNTGDIDQYNKSINELAKELEKATGVEAGKWVEGLNQQFEGLSYADAKLNKFLQSYNSSLDQLRSGDSLAINLKKQFEELANFSDLIDSEFIATGKIDVELLAEVKESESFKYLPQQIQTAIDGIISDNKVTEAEQDILLRLKTIIQNEGALDDDVSEQLNRLFQGKSTQQELEIGIKIGDYHIPPDLMKILNSEYEGKNTEINFKINTENIEKLDEITQKHDKLDGKTTESTHKINSEGAEEVKNDIDEINEGKKELEKPTNLSINKGELQGSVDEFNKLIEYSTKLKDGEYQISFKSDTADAIAKIDNLKLAVNNLSNQFREIPSTTITLETSLAAKNISGLLIRIEQVKTAIEGIKGKTIQIATSLSAKNLSGLIARVNQYRDAINNTPDKTTNIHTSLSAKNLSGLIAKIGSYNSTKISEKTVKVNVSNAISQVNTLLSKINALPSSKTVRINVSQSGSVAPKVSPRSVFAMGEQGDVAGGTSPVADTYSLLSSMPYDATPFDVTSNVGNDAFISPRSSSNGMLVSNNPIASPMLRKISSTDAKNMFDYDVDIFKKLENSLKKISNELDIISKKSENAFGQEKINYLQKQIELLKQQQQLQHNLAEDMRVQQGAIKDYLLNKGFTFDIEDNISNYSQKLLAYEKHLENVKKKADAAKDNDKLQAQYEATKQDLDKIKESLSQYLSLTFDKIPEASKEWWDLQNSISDTREEIEKINREQKLFITNNKLSELENEYKSISNTLDFIDKKSESFYGSEKISFLKEQVNLLEQQKNKLHEMANTYREQINIYKGELVNFGFAFDDLGNVKNIDEVLNNLVNSSDFEKAKDILKEYLDIQNDKLPQASRDWWDLENAIKDTLDSVEKLNREQKLFATNNKLLELTDHYDGISNAIDMLEAKEENFYGKDRLDIISQKIDLLEQQKNKLHEIADTYREQLGIYREDLSKYGFTFDASGNISDIDEVLNKHKNSVEFKKIKELVEEYLDIQKNKIPDASKEWWNLENAIKDAYKEQLNITKEIEDKITEIYKKQIKDRIEAMNSETDKKVENLKKQKDAYNKYREEVNYKDEYEEKLANINDIQKQLDIAMRDTSLQGQKKVQELQKLLADAQKELDKYTQQKIDSDINDAFDKEMDRIEEANKNAIEKLEKEWSDSKIAEMVSQAISSGIFEGIDGKVSGLQDAMLEFAEETGELFGVMGTVIKSELISNLDIAMSTFKDLGNIIKNLDLEKFSTLSSGFNVNMNAMPSMASSASSIVLNAPMINIEGDVNKDVVEDLKSFSDKLVNDVINKISSSIR